MEVTSAWGFLAVPPGGGLVVYLDLLSADVLLDHLHLFHDLLADAELLPDDRSLLHHHLFLDDRHHYLVFADLRPRGLSLGDRYALYRYLHALLGNDDSLPVGAHALAHPHRPGLALAGADLELLL